MSVAPCSGAGASSDRSCHTSNYLRDRLPSCIGSQGKAPDRPRHQGLPRPCVGDPAGELLGRTQPNNSALGVPVPSGRSQRHHVMRFSGCGAGSESTRSTRRAPSCFRTPARWGWMGLSRSGWGRATGLAGRRTGSSSRTRRSARRKRIGDVSRGIARVFAVLPRLMGATRGVDGSLAQRTNVDQGRFIGHVLGGDERLP